MASLPASEPAAEINLAALDDAPVVEAPQGDLALPRDPSAATMDQPMPEDLAKRMPTDEAPEAAGAVAEQNQFSEYGLPCAVEITAEAGIAAMVNLDLAAPCYANSPVTITHEGLRFTTATDATGSLSLAIPAFAEMAEVGLTFDTGAEAVAAVQITDFSSFDRVAMQWQGQTDMQIHAFEYGSDYEEQGHVWAGAAHSPARGERRQGGFMTTLGIPGIPGGWVAEVYSFPAAEAPEQGVIRLNVEAEVTSATCGRDVRAQILQPGLNGGLEPVELTLAVPSCDAVGEFLVLKNVLRDMKIASN